MPPAMFFNTHGNGGANKPDGRAANDVTSAARVTIYMKSIILQTLIEFSGEGIDQVNSDDFELADHLDNSR
jgi:hypothetical protein